MRLHNWVDISNAMDSVALSSSEFDTFLVICPETRDVQWAPRRTSL